jgi:DNA-binding response OmpR family regulator
LEFLRNGGYDLIVTDQGMPGMTGATFVEAVREFGNSPPVVMLTGFGGLMKSSGLTPHGVDLILNKPVTRQALRSALIAIFPSDAPRE